MYYPMLQVGVCFIILLNAFMLWETSLRLAATMLGAA